MINNGSMHFCGLWVAEHVCAQMAMATLMTTEV